MSSSPSTTPPRPARAAQAPPTGPKDSAATAARSARLAAVALIALALAGCTAEVSTDITVTSPTASAITAAVTFTGDAGRAVQDDPKIETQVSKVFTDRAGVTPQVTREGSAITYTAELTYPQMTAASGVLGISNARLTGTKDLTTLTMTLVRPDALDDALTAAVKGQPDASALTATMRAATSVSVNARFAGGVERATFGAGTVTVEGERATLTQTLSSYQAGTMTVSGDPSAPLLTPVRGAAGAGAVALAGFVWWRRRR